MRKLHIEIKSFTTCICLLMSAVALCAKPSYNEYVKAQDLVQSKFTGNADYQSLLSTVTASKSALHDYLNSTEAYTMAKGQARQGMRIKLVKQGDGKALDERYRADLYKLDQWLASQDSEYAVFYASYKEIPVSELGKKTAVKLPRPSYDDYLIAHHAARDKFQHNEACQLLVTELSVVRAARDEFLNRSPEYVSAAGNRRAELKTQLVREGEGLKLDTIYRDALEKVDLWMGSMDRHYAAFYAAYKEIPIEEITGGASADPQGIDQNFMVTPDLSYSADDPRNVLDLYLPKDYKKQQNPAVIFVHGGGFRGGSKGGRTIESFGKSFASRGFVTAVINYRLYLNGKGKDASCTSNMGQGLQEGGFHPDLRKAVQIAATDARKALVWLDSKSEEYNISEINMIGGSAGAMASLYCVFGDLPDAPPLVKVDAIVSLWGGLEDVSIINGEQKPDILFIHGEDDTTIDSSFSQDMYLQSQEKGLRSFFIPMRNQGHAQYNVVHRDYVDYIVELFSL